MNNVTFRQLRALAAIASAGSIAKAANDLHLTGPAVTLQLKQLEAELGVELFARARSGMRQTDAGHAALEAVQRIEAVLADLADRIDALKGLRAGRLTLGVVSTAKYFAPGIVAAFRRAHPGIALSLLVGNRAEIIAHLSEMRVDLALMGRPPAHLPVDAIVVGDHPLVLIAPPQHPLGKRRRIAKEKLAGEHFLIREEGSGTRIAHEIFLADLPDLARDPGTAFGSNETIKQAVMAGLGIALISGHTVAAEVESGRLVLLDVVGLPIRRQWYAVRRSDRSLPLAAGTFRDFLVAEAARHMPSLGRPAPAGA